MTAAAETAAGGATGWDIVRAWIRSDACGVGLKMMLDRKPVDPLVAAIDAALAAERRAHADALAEARAEDDIDFVEAALERARVAEADAARLRELLRRVKWITTGWTGEDGADPMRECPLCEGWHEDGHTPDCALAAALARPSASQDQGGGPAPLARGAEGEGGHGR